ncbi:phosphotransferase enzyme family protein [Histoplasma capsulatum H143]|uniref:Phosphotransferase enzyme family protein n=1 Tax=Ajellomyces capsulatus (strain H143) TaxID=544712 RepID=C6HPV1_AJECH|nr:phosphotransferase enzyme family protein [Histoplasma capsulatum H143]
MWEPVSLPFKSSSLPLPTLPTTDEIRSCSDILWERCYDKIVAVNDKVVIKFGGSVSVWEGQALIYLEKHVPQVSAPRLYAMYQESNQVFLVMQRIPGVRLDSIWPSLTPSEKDDIVAKLRQMFDTMRQAECPWPNFFGGLDGGGVYHYLFYSQTKGDQKHLGPFHGGAAFAAGLAGNFRALTERNGRPDYKVRLYETHLASVLQDRRPTLTHGDVHQKNIMVVENLNDQGGRSFDVVLVDWERAGWYPDFWEFFCAASLFDMCYWEEEWCWQVQQFLQVPLAELAIMRMIDKDLGWGR